MTTWTVLGPGPSLRDFKLEHKDIDGPVVAVNLAIYAKIWVDFWLCLDEPPHMEQVWSEHPGALRRCMPIVWCQDYHAKLWRELNMRALPFAGREADFRKQNIPTCQRQFTMTHWAIPAAVSRCIGMGARRINVVGWDLKGNEHAYGTDPENRPVEHWLNRWDCEREIKELALKEWEHLGVEINVRPS